MPPRRSARRSVTAEPCIAALAPLPLALAQHIFLLLPVDSRARAACVARGWRDALADAALWTRLDLSSCDSGVARSLDAALVLQGAARRAAGRPICHLDVAGLPHLIPQNVLLEMVAGNAATLRELRVGALPAARGAFISSQNLLALARAAPAPQALHTGVKCSGAEAPSLLRAEPPFAPLRLSALKVVFVAGVGGNVHGGLEHVAPFAAALADAALQPTLSDVSICFADTAQPAVLDALVDAALAARRLRSLELSNCSPPAGASLARLLAGGALTSLTLASIAGSAPLFDTAGAALVARAMRATTALTSLQLCRANVCRDMRAAGVLLSALVGHRSLRSLTLTGDHPAVPAVLGTALAALVAADAPALQELDVSSNALGDEGLAPLVDALPCNCHCARLDVCNNRTSERFARKRLLPAVRANTSLRDLHCRGNGLFERWPAAVAAEESGEAPPAVGRLML
jgi:hypothetical protein